jgi:DMSO/TMAO reductase YedYZ heme-binding membrane subunit
MIRRRSVWVVAGVWLVGGLWAAWTCRGDADAYSRAVALTRACGWGALLALCAALCASPLERLARWRGRAPSALLPAGRRALGIAAGSCALLHAAAALVWLPGTRETLWSAAQLRMGLAALSILALLLATSFRPLLHSWKELHRLAYVAALCAFLHVIFGPFAPLRSVLAVAGFTFAFGWLRLLRPK